MKTRLTIKNRVGFLDHVALVAATLLLTLFTSVPARAESGLVAKLYSCPQGQAAITADTLKNEYGAIPGVRVFVLDQTSQVFVQAPPEVQTRISQRLAAAFPNQEPPAEKPTANRVEVRQVALKRISTDQFEAALWNTLGNRLAAMPEQRIGSRGYRLALSNGGSVAIWIDLENKQVKLEGATVAIDATTRLIQVLDSPQDPAGRNVASDGRATRPVGQCQAGGDDDSRGQRRPRRPICPWRPRSCKRGRPPPERAAMLHPYLPRQRAATLHLRPPRRRAALASPTAPAGGSPTPTPPAPGDVSEYNRIVNPVTMESSMGSTCWSCTGSKTDVDS